MNPRERFLTAASGGNPDCVPAAPYMGNFGAAVAGVPIDRYCRDGRLMAEAQRRAWEMCGQDVVVPQSDGYYLAEGFGVQVEHHHDATPTVVAPAFRDLPEVVALPVPEPTRDGRMPVYLEAIERLRGHFGDEVAVRATGTGPFSLAAHLMGTEEFLMRLAMLAVEANPEDERLLRLLMAKTTDALIAFARAALAAGADVVQAGDSLASLDMISPAIYASWVWPSEKRFFEILRPEAEARGAVTLLHICGDTTAILPEMASTGAHILEIDAKVDLGRAKEMVGDQVCLMGNLEPTEVLLRGDADRVRRESERAIALAGGAGGFVLGSGCEVPPRAPAENIIALVETAHAHPIR